MTRISSSFLLCMNLSLSNIFYGRAAYFSTHPSAPPRSLGGRILQKVIVMKSPSGLLALSSGFLHLHAVCVCIYMCEANGFSRQAEVGVQVYILYSTSVFM